MFFESTVHIAKSKCISSWVKKTQEIALAKNHHPSTMKQSEPSPKTKIGVF